jgi:hypothetical protein
VSLTSQSFGLPHGSARSAFETAARAHQAARQMIGAPLPAPLERASGETSSVEGAIANASRQTGVDFAFLLAQARVESALDPAAKARTSSASGLYQFIESTWLDTMKRHGARFGLGALADSIGVNATGAAVVTDPARRNEILALRHDPQIAAWMAAGLAEDNRAHLAPILGRQPDHGELYLAHFLGAGGAGRFVSAMQDNPHQGAAGLFAKAAAANPGIFYEPDGSERSLAGVMRNLSGKIERAMGLAPRAPYSPAWANYAPPPAAPGDYAQGGPTAPYLIADEAVFLPVGASLVTGGGGAPGSAQASARRTPLSDVLSATFGAATGAPATSPRAQAQVRRAYQQLKALGL